MNETTNLIENKQTNRQKVNLMVSTERHRYEKKERIYRMLNFMEKSVKKSEGMPDVVG